MNSPNLTSEDRERLSGQCGRIMAHADGIYRSLKEWAEIANGASEAGVSARLRQISNEYGYIKEKRNEGGGLWLYRILPPGLKSVEYQFDSSGQGAFL